MTEPQTEATEGVEDGGEDEETLYRTYGRFNAEAVEALEELRDAILADAPDAVTRADCDTIDFHPGIRVEGEMSDDLREDLQWHQSNWLGEHSQFDLTPAAVEVNPGGKLVDGVILRFEEGISTTRMDQAADAVKHGAENVLYPDGTTVPLVVADDDIPPFKRVRSDDPEGIIEWAQSLDTDALEEMLPEKMGLAGGGIEQREEPFGNDD